MPSFLSSRMSGKWSFGSKKTRTEDGESSRDSQASPIGLSSRGESMMDKRYTSSSIDEISKYRAVVKFLHQRLVTCQWLPPQTGDPTQCCSGVFLRRTRGVYMTEPEVVHPELLAAVRKINAEVAFTMATETTNIITSLLTPEQTMLVLPNGFQVQVIDSIEDIAASPTNIVKKFQYAALIRRERLLLVWHDDLDVILSHAANVEGKLLSLIWGSAPPNIGSRRESAATSPAASAYHLALDSTEISGAVIEESSSAEATLDEEAVQQKESLDRPVALTSSIFVGLAMMLIVVLLLGIDISNLLLESFTDGDKIRFALVAVLPIFFILSAFFFVIIFTDIFQAIGPIKTLKTNTVFYSPVRPDMRTAYAQGFTPPRITIQIPVYTESLKGVIIPTINSLKAAVSHYESHGGTANIFINDDGFAYLSEEDRQERINFYHDNNVGWVARPKNNEDGYIRKGKFKKASNMNFALNVSNSVEVELLGRLTPILEKTDMIDPVEEELIYQQAFDHVIEANPRVQAGGNIRIGEFILIVDSDTRVPVDCLLYGAAEMFLSPEVAIVQHSTSVLQVSYDYFENGISFFTNLIYSAVRFSVGSGELAPFVGHNAFLRWQAVQSVGSPGDGYTVWWSEDHVSEDFDLALRLQIQGNVVRLASYHKDEFKEGVSLTIYDELSRWRKYSYGVTELVFNPVHTWVYRGPLTKLFMRFLWSNLQMSSKLTIFGYISSYFAIASGFPLTILNYFIVGWFNGYLDKIYMESWRIFLGVLIAFSLLGNICLAVMRARLGEKHLWSALVENFKWMPMMTVFFGGLSFHLSLAILSHLFGFRISWSTTAKEKVDSNFFKEIPKIIKSFKWMYAVVLPFFPAMIYLGCFAPRGWTITEIAVIVPVSVTLGLHAIFPLVLNPSLMVFNY